MVYKSLLPLRKLFKQRVEDKATKGSNPSSMSLPSVAASIPDPNEPYPPSTTPTVVDETGMISFNIGHVTPMTETQPAPLLNPPVALQQAPVLNWGTKLSLPHTRLHSPTEWIKAIRRRKEINFLSFAVC